MTIFIVRLSAMGDIIHTLPAVASLKKSFPSSHLAWAVAPRWAPLVEGNPFIDELIPFDRRRLAELGTSWKRLRELQPDLAIDFQGLLYSALIGRASRPTKLYGFDSASAREPLAARFYTHCASGTAVHRVDKNLQLARAAGASQSIREVWLPEGLAEGELPATPYILSSPFAGWASKQWPIENYELLTERLNRAGFELVVNVPRDRLQEIGSFKHLRVHAGSLQGLIAATRRATAVLGLDSGPMHLAAALHKPGVALFGPTDPQQTGPYSGSLIVLRGPGAVTTYKRHNRLHPAMTSITVEEVARALLDSIASARNAAHVELHL